MLVAEIAKAMIALANESSWGTKDPSFKAVKAALGDLKQRLAESVVKNYMMSSAFEISEKITAIEKGLGSMSLTALNAAIAAIKVSVVTIETGAGLAKTAADEFEKTTKTVEDGLDKEPIKTSAPAFAASIKGRLKALIADAKFEGGLVQAQKDLEKLKAEIRDVLASPANDIGVPVELFERQQQAVAAEKVAELDKSKWDGEIVVLEKLLKAAHAGSIDSREIEALEGTLEDTKKAIAKSKAWADGRDQLRSIRTRLQLLETNPFGLVISARNRVQEVTRFVKGEIRRLHKELNVLKTQVDKTDLSDTDKKGNRAADRLGAWSVRSGCVRRLVPAGRGGGYRDEEAIRRARDRFAPGPPPDVLYR